MCRFEAEMHNSTACVEEKHVWVRNFNFVKLSTYCSVRHRASALAALTSEKIHWVCPVNREIDCIIMHVTIWALWLNHNWCNTIKRSWSSLTRNNWNRCLRVDASTCSIHGCNYGHSLIKTHNIDTQNPSNGRAKVFFEAQNHLDDVMWLRWVWMRKL